MSCLRLYIKKCTKKNSLKTALQQQGGSIERVFSDFNV